MQDKARKTNNFAINQFTKRTGLSKFEKTGNEYTHESYDKKYSHITNGFKDIGRGLVEAIPLIGNLAVLALDKLRRTACE